MHPGDALVELGGVASTVQLLALTTRRQLRTAVESGDVLRLARDRYGIRAGREALLAAGRLNGVASHLSAAVHYEWPVLETPERPHVTVPLTRRVEPSRCARCSTARRSWTSPRPHRWPTTRSSPRSA